MQKLRKTLLTILSLSVTVLGFPSITFAQGAAQVAPGDVIGTVEAPPGVADYNKLVGGGPQDIGIILFASNMLKVGAVVAGLIVFYNFLMAGFNYITADGDSNAMKKVIDEIKSSVIGLILIVTAYAVTAVISLMIFGDANFILNPTIKGPN